MIRKLIALFAFCALPLAAGCSVDADDGGDDCVIACTTDRDECVEACDEDGDCITACDEGESECGSACL